MCLLRSFLALSLCFLFAGGASAQTAVPGLYEARVAVGSQADGDRSRATREGMEQVLTRMTGLPEVTEESGIADLLGDAERYVHQYGYEDVVDDDHETGLELLLQFDGSTLQRTLSELEVPVWVEADRPRVLIWLAVDRNGERELVGGDTGPDIQEMIRHGARQHGLPVLLPLQDLEDRGQLSSSDVWGGFRGPILEASERYRAEVVLAGRVAQRGEGYEARWLLFRNDGVDEWSESGEQLEAVAHSGPAGAARRLARDMARLPGQRIVGDVTLQVDGVETLEGFGYVRRLLDDTRGVSDVEVLQVYGETLYMRIQLEGDSDRLIRDLERGGRLQQLSPGSMASPAAERPAVDMGFRLEG